MDENETLSAAANAEETTAGAEENADKAADNADNDTAGLDYLTRLSYACTDRSDLTFTEKRDLLFSVYSFRCLFDGRELHRLSAVLVKYGCSFFTESAGAKKYEHVYEVEAGGKKGYKFDAGSPFFAHAVKAGKITGEKSTVPEKLTLYEMAYRLVTLSSATAELKAMWLVYFPYVFMIGAPIEYDICDRLKEVVMTPEVFSAANEGRYADNICCTTAELNSEHPMIADWYRPFIEWKSERNDKGVSRETAKYQRALARQEFPYVVAGTEKLLDSFPDDEEILLLNISARMSMAPSVGLQDRVKLLSQTYAMICDALAGPVKKYNYFMYYRGLARLGMQDPEGAEEDFRACLERDPKFEPALLVLKGMRTFDKKKS